RRRVFAALDADPRSPESVRDCCRRPRTEVRVEHEVPRVARDLEHPLEQALWLWRVEHLLVRKQPQHLAFSVAARPSEVRTPKRRRRHPGRRVAKETLESWHAVAFGAEPDVIRRNGGPHPLGVVNPAAPLWG